MSFGGRSFKKDDPMFKRELQLLAKKSQTEFASLASAEKAAILEQSSNFKLHDKKTRKKKNKDAITKEEIKLDPEACYAPPSPSIDLDPELRDRPETQLSRLDSVQMTDGDRSTLMSASQKVASIKSNVDLSVVMQGKGIADGDRMSKASSIQSKAGQRAAGGRPPSRRLMKSATSRQGAKSPEVPVQSGPKPAIIPSQQSTMRIQLIERENVPPAKQAERSTSKATKTRQSSAKSMASVKSAASHRISPRDNVVVLPSPDNLPEDADVIDEPPTDAPHTPVAIIPKASESEPATPIPPEEDTYTKTPDNEYDHIHSEILKMTQSLSFPDEGLMNLLSNREDQDAISDDLAELTAQSESTQAMLHKFYSQHSDREFSIIGATKSVSPRLPQTPKTPAGGRMGSTDEGASTQHLSYMSPMKAISEANAAIERKSIAAEAMSTRGKPASQSASREWTGLVTRDSYLLTRQTSLTEDQARQDLQLSLDVKPEDIINIKGQQSNLANKDTTLPVNHIKNMSSSLLMDMEKQRSERQLTFLGTWKGKDTDRVVPEHNIHHFCTMATEMEVSPHLYKLTRDVHTPDRFPRVRQRCLAQQRMSGIGEAQELYMYQSEETILSDEGDREEEDKDAEDRRLSLVAHRILEEAISADIEETMARLKRASDSLFFEEPGDSLQIDGVQIELKDDTSRLYWTPAPPKMGLQPETVKSYLYPEYEGAAMLRESLGTDHVTLAAVVESEDEEEDEDDVINAEDRQARDRTLKRAHGSLSDLRQIQEQQVATPGEKSDGVVGPSDMGRDGQDSQVPTVRFVSVLDQRRQQQHRDKLDSGESEEDSDQQQQAEEQQERRRPFRRACSEPMLDLNYEDQLKVSSGYDVSMKELDYQKDVIAAIKNRMQEVEDEEEDMAEQSSSRKQRREDQHTAHESTRSHSTILDFHRANEDTDERTETENMSVTTATSKATGLSKMPRMPRMRARRRVKRKSQKDIEREHRISEFKMQPAHPITRSCSFNTLAELKSKEVDPVKAMLDNIEQEESLKRANSVPCLLDFGRFIEENSVGPVGDMYDWIREQYWYEWFDEVYPPSPASPQAHYDLLTVTTPRVATGASKSSGTVINSAILDTIQVIEPEISNTNNDLYTALKDEAERLDELIEKTEKKETLAMYLCRRGAVNRKIGELKKAWEDFNKAIELENMLLDAYWHRHLLYLLQNNKKAALDDLTFIIKNSGSQARAFRSRAELYRQEGDATMAIVNYSQAVKLNPNDVETYYQRAAMFKMRGDMLLALEDYKIASRLLPSKTDAMFEIGIYRFNNENWTGAVNDFTEILQQDPNESRAYSYRGRVFAKMGKFNPALRDLSAAIHYDPNNAVAFYQRGCILRKIHPRRALQDFSVSLLLDDSVTNVNAFMHRGILYTDMKRWEDAIPDFEAAIQLDPTLASAHVNIGLIYIIKYSNYQKAIRQYTSAIRVDATYVRALICRAEAYHKMGMLQEAVLDYARTIHMRPDVSDYHMARGKLLLEQKKLDLASFHVKQAAELNQGLGASATQQAVVHSFLKNFDQAIEVLERATRSKPSSQMFTLLGKTNMKAKRFQDAIASFEKAIEILTPWNNRVPMPQEAASVHFLIGMCQSELHNYPGALDAFNEAIKVNPDYAEAFYHRGLIKMKLRHTKGVHDFNRALAINPKLFQAFLSRAAYYGMKGRYSKGIMSCNEAIKLQPQSVRAYLYRGALKYHIKAFGLAVKDLTEAVAIDCRCSLAYFNRAVCHHEMRYFQKALMDYGTVMLLEVKPNLKVLQNRGLLYLEIGDIENALLDFKAATKVATMDPKIRHTLGLCYHKLNQLEESVAAYDDALRIDPFFVEAYNGRGNALMDFGHEQGNVLGRRDYLKALHMDPLCLSARVNLAYNLQVEGKFQAAWNQFSAAIAIDSTCQAALEGRAVINLQMRNTFGAFVDMNDALKISKTAELLNNRGVVQQYMSDYVNAVRDYQAAIRVDPSYALSYYNAGNVYFRQRQFKQALSYYNKALSWTLEDESAVLNRAITKVMLRDPRGAIQDFNRAVELNPYAAHVYFNRANLYASLRKYKEAEDDYTRALSLRPGDALVYKRRADVMGKQSKREAAIQDYKKAIIIKTRARAGRG